MALETGTYVNALVPSNPASTDGLAQADDHIRLLKTTIKATFPSVTGAITATQSELNVLSGLTATTGNLNVLTGTAVTPAQFETLASGVSGIVPSGGIILWSGTVASVPSG